MQSRIRLCDNVVHRKTDSYLALNASLQLIASGPPERNPHPQVARLILPHLPLANKRLH
jgi:hypothetical protein